MKKLFSTKIELKLWQRIVLFLLLSGCILIGAVFLQAGPMMKTLANFRNEPKLLLLNLFPVLIVLGLLYALMNNLFYAGALSSLLILLLSLANLIKVECRRDPLVPDDFGLIGEALIATSEYELDLHLPYLFGILLFAALLVLLGVRFKSRLRGWTRVIAVILVVALFIGAMMTAYPSAKLYDEVIASVDGLYYANVPTVFAETGFLYCFLHNYGLYEVHKPEGYSEAETAAWAARRSEPAASPLPVNLIFIQCEAFTDLYDAPIFTYTEEDNPLCLYHQIAQSEQSISGQIVVSNFGAGTANTEFDVMTGVGILLLNENSTSAFRVVHKKMPSLARIFTGLGYDAWFMHPGQSWFYNRDSVYDRFGIDERTFDTAFASTADYARKGGRVSDEAFGKMLIERYEAHKAASDAPWFAFTVTIQNHQSYRWGKYKPDPPKAEAAAPLSDSAMEAASVYAEGVRDSARLLQQLTAYFDAEQEPTLIVFWGDHLPALGSGFSVYQELGLNTGKEEEPQDVIDTYATPYLIYGNRAYCERYDLAARAAALELPAGGQLSDVYLGELVYELLDLQGTDPYFDFLGEARRILPVYSHGRFALPDGTLTMELDEQAQAVFDKLCRWGYYRAKDERVN